jgi:hypothetical protein
MKKKKTMYSIEMVRIVELSKPDFKKIKMNCDDVIDDKLVKYPMIKEAFSTSSFNVIVGKMGQGKTSWITNYIKNIAPKCYETIYVFIPHNSRASIENDIYGKNIAPEQLFDTLTFDDLNQVYEEIQEHLIRWFENHMNIKVDEIQIFDNVDVA